MDGTDGFDPQRIVWRMVDSQLWIVLLMGHIAIAPQIEPYTNNALAHTAFLHADRTAL